MTQELTTENIDDFAATFRSELKNIEQPRSDYQLANFVVGEKDTIIARYAQCLLEMSGKDKAIRQALLDLQLIDLDIQEFEAAGDPRSILLARKKLIDKEALEGAVLGAKREFICLYKIWQSFGQKYTYEEIQQDQILYWRERLARQAEQDVIAQGRIGVGNLDALRQAGFMEISEDGNAIYKIPVTTDRTRRISALPSSAGNGG